MNLDPNGFTVLTPGGETIHVVPDYIVDYPLRIQENSSTSLLLQALFLHGAFVSDKGLTSPLILDFIRNELGHEVTVQNSANAAKLLNGIDCLDRDVRGKRTYHMSIAGKSIPQRWYDRFLKKFSETAETLESVPEETAEPEPDPIESGRVDAILHVVEDAARLLLSITDVSAPAQSGEIRELREMVSILTAENQRLSSELNRLSRQLRGETAPQQASPKPQRAPLSFRELGVKDARYRRLIRHAYECGFEVEKLSGGHIRFIPPDPTRPLVTGSATPSDHRSVLNLHAQLVRSKMPRLEGL